MSRLGNRTNFRHTNGLRRFARTRYSTWDCAASDHPQYQVGLVYLHCLQVPTCCLTGLGHLRHRPFPHGQYLDCIRYSRSRTVRQPAPWSRSATHSESRTGTVIETCALERVRAVAAMVLDQPSRAETTGLGLRNRRGHLEDLISGVLGSPASMGGHPLRQFIRKRPQRVPRAPLLGGWISPERKDFEQSANQVSSPASQH